MNRHRFNSLCRFHCHESGNFCHLKMRATQKSSTDLPSQSRRRVFSRLSTPSFSSPFPVCSSHRPLRAHRTKNNDAHTTDISWQTDINQLSNRLGESICCFYLYRCHMRFSCYRWMNCDCKLDPQILIAAFALRFCAPCRLRSCRSGLTFRCAWPSETTSAASNGS